jgi:hypothetical protein
MLALSLDQKTLDLFGHSECTQSTMTIAKTPKRLSRNNEPKPKSYITAFKIRRDVIKQKEQQNSMFENQEDATMFMSGVSSIRDMRGCFGTNQNICVNTIDINESATLELIDYMNTPKSGLLFIDSGAFRVLGDEKAKPIDFNYVFQYYFRLAFSMSKPTKLTVCAPDVIGNQGKSLDMQLQYKDKLRQLINMGVNAIFPLQNGSLKLADVYKILCDEFRESNVIAGLPAAAEAIPREDFMEFLEGKPNKVHILGANKNKRFVKEAQEKSPTTSFSCDSNRICAYVGAGRPLTELHHDLTDTALNFYKLVTENMNGSIDIPEDVNWLPEKWDVPSDFTEFDAERTISQFSDAEFEGLCESLTPYISKSDLDLTKLPEMIKEESIIEIMTNLFNEDYAYTIHNHIWYYNLEVLKEKLTKERASPMARTQSIHIACENHLFEVSSQ